MVREDLLALVMSGAWRSSSERMVVKNERRVVKYDNTPVLQPSQTFIAKSIQNIKDFGNWLWDYILPKPKVVDEALKSLKV